MNKPNENHVELIKATLDDIKAIDIVTLDVHKQTSVTDFMIICSGRSSRHVKAIAEDVMLKMKEHDLPPLSHHGFESGEWALVDFGYIVVHVMQADTRAFYDIEGLWQKTATH